jgi:hypothetical protein
LLLELFFAAPALQLSCMKHMEKLKVAGEAPMSDFTLMTTNCIKVKMMKKTLKKSEAENLATWWKQKLALSHFYYSVPSMVYPRG